MRTICKYIAFNENNNITGLKECMLGEDCICKINRECAARDADAEMETMNERRTAEKIYEANRPRFHDWGTLKKMCLASMQEYADQETIAIRAELAAAKEKIKQLESTNAAAMQNISQLKEWIHSHM